MGKLVVFKMGVASSDSEVLATVQIALENARPTIEVNGKLPYPTLLLQHYHQWQVAYRSLVRHSRLDAPSRQQTNVSSLEDCTAAAHVLITGFNTWLQAPSFQPIRDTLLQQLAPSEAVRLLVQVDDRVLQQLPWHLWELYQWYPQLEIAISPSTYRQPEKPNHQHNQVRILAILGNSQGIDVQADRQLLQQLPQAEVQFLVEPQRWQLSDELWTSGWDILFFAGHSSSQGQQGTIGLNATEDLPLDQLCYALRKAIANGLQLAIFNSCDGLGLAHQLAALHLPQIIIMREPVPDRVAQMFLKYFLTEFAAGQSFHLSVRAARERLQGWEGEFPYASWLPMIIQNPIANPPTWRSLTTAAAPHQQHPPDGMITMVFTDLVGSTAMKNRLGGESSTANQHYVDRILMPHRERIQAELNNYGGRVVKTMGDGHFLVFTNAVQAVQWAVTLQRSHQHQAIPTPLGSLQVRIGMHTGTPLPDGDDFLGQEVDYAARVADLANGGQIVLSEVTAILIRNGNVPKCTTHTHGTRLLKGIGKVPVFELLYDGKSPGLLRTDKRPPVKWAALIATLGATFFVLGLRSLGWLQIPELRAFDQLMRQRPHENTDDRILIVEATEEDINRYGFPLPDITVAAIIQQLQTHQPRVIGLDIFRDRPVGNGHTQLMQLLRQNNTIIGLCSGKIADNPNKPGISPPPGMVLDRVGFSDVVKDPDDVLRRHLLFMQPRSDDPCQTEDALGVKTALHYLMAQGVDLEYLPSDRIQLNKTILTPLETNTGAYQNLDARGFQILLNYRATEEVARSVTVTDLLTGKVNPAWVNDKIVLIGVTAPISNATDYFSTPYSAGALPYKRFPGVMVQAHSVSQLISAVLDHRPLLWVLPAWGEGVWILGWAAIGSLIGGYCHRMSMAGTATAVALGGLYGTCWFCLLQGGWLPLLPPAIGLLSTSASITIYKIFWNLRV
jgi:CHASE2 domain-containing sensor protein